MKLPFSLLFCALGLFPLGMNGQGQTCTATGTINKIDTYVGFGNALQAGTYITTAQPIYGSAGQLQVYLNGVLRTLATDYNSLQTLAGSGATIIFNSPPFSATGPATNTSVIISYCTYIDFNYTVLSPWASSGSGGGSMTWPSGIAGVPFYSGASTWGTSLSVGTGANNLIQLNGSGQLPAVSAALLTNWPTFNQNTTGTAAGLTTYPTLCSSGQFSLGLSSGSNNCATPPGGGSGMTWPSTAGIANYNGSSAWGTSLSVGTGANNIVQLNCSGATTGGGWFSFT